MNPELFKRYSTYANALAAIVAAVLLVVPDLGFSAQTTALVMLVGNITVAVCQVIKQSYPT